MGARCSTGKVRHAERVGACIAAKRLKSNRLNVYRCAECNGWHIGNSSSPFRFQKRLDQIFARDRRRAQGTEARRAETTQIGSVHDGPVAESDAPDSEYQRRLNTMTDELTKLAERCEREQPSYDLNEAICKATAGPDGNYIHRDYVSSLDAAMTLVPEGGNHFPTVSKFFNGRWNARCYEQFSGEKNEASAATPALALCAAALKSRASQ